MSESLSIPFREILKSIPGIFGIRLEKEPKHRVVATLDEGVEIRSYASALLAEVTLAGQHDEAVDQAFDRLAAYIFGANSDDVKLPMSIPVLQRKAAAAEGRLTPIETRGESWTVSFFLSNDLIAAEAPVPTDPSIHLVTVPEKLVAATTFRGNNTAERRSTARAELLKSLAGQSRFVAVTGAWWAQFDAPFVLPFAKKNEAQIEVMDTGASVEATLGEG